MSLSCSVRGVGEEVISAARWEALVTWINGLSARFDWDCESFQLQRPRDGEDGKVWVFTKLQQGQETEFDRDICQCVVLTYRLSEYTPGWTWHVTDDIDCIETSVNGALTIRNGEAVSKTDAGDYVSAPAIEDAMQSYIGQSVSMGDLGGAPRAPSD